jgi:GntR family transcriptional regulator/MocR family aminotransferase
MSCGFGVFIFVYCLYKNVSLLGALKQPIYTIKVVQYMHPAFSSIQLYKSSTEPVYLQLANDLTRLIKEGQLVTNSRLPSSRQMAELLGLHRKTVVRAYDELLAQGWLESRMGSGTFVASHIPKLNVKSFVSKKQQFSSLEAAGFKFDPMSHLNRKPVKPSPGLHLDDGFPDARLAPLTELSRAYRTQLLTGDSYHKLGYADAQGAMWLREELARHLNDTRGLNITAANLLITRGSSMGLFLASTAFLRPGDHVVVGSPGWLGAERNFIQAGAILSKIGVDEHGLQVDDLEMLCKKKKIRMVYVTPHHHHPTTVGLRSDRRLQLLKLSAQYGFIIFEDDYDYDFHYQSKPLLPLIAADQSGMVLYCGSFSKTMSPAFRVGYLVAPVDVIQQLSKLRSIVDRQGDNMLENAIAELLQSGVLQRYLRKSVRVYRERRDVLTGLLKSELGDDVQFKIPDGGMAVWVNFMPDIVLPELAEKAYKKGLRISDGFLYRSSVCTHNAIRLGFASSTVSDIEKSVAILRDLMPLKRSL